MPFTEESDKKQLYEFNNSYLKDLNQIRKQLNLVAIAGEENEDDTVTKVPSPSQISFNEELYNCSTDYLKELNQIRKAFNLKEIADEGQNVEDLSKLPFENNGAIRRKNETKKMEKDNTYTPPKKKKCVRENSIEEIKTIYPVRKPDLDGYRNSHKVEETDFSSPSEKSSPVREDRRSRKLNIKPPLDGHFCSLNVPTSNSPEKSPLRPKITVLVDEKGISSPRKRHSVRLSEDSEKSEDRLVRRSFGSPKKWLTTGLDLPRMSKELYSFPSVVHIGKWANIFSQQTRFDNIFSENMDKKSARRKLTVDGAIEGFPDLIDEKTKAEKLIEIETISSLNNMYHLKKKNEEESNVEEDNKSENEEEVKKGCSRCFSICFIRKPKNFFS